MLFYQERFKKLNREHKKGDTPEHNPFSAESFIDQSPFYPFNFIEYLNFIKKPEKQARGGTKYAVSYVNLIISSSAFLLNGRPDRLVGHFWFQAASTGSLSLPPFQHRKNPGAPPQSA